MSGARQATFEGIGDTGELRYWEERLGDGFKWGALGDPAAVRTAARMMLAIFPGYVGAGAELKEIVEGLPLEGFRLYLTLTGDGRVIQHTARTWIPVRRRKK